MKGLITDRTQRNVYYRKELANKGLSRMTSDEKADWLGNPLDVYGANLFTFGPAYSATVNLRFRSEEIVATTKVGGTYLFSILIIGEASDFENQVLTFSLDAITSSGGGKPMISFWWHDDDGNSNYAGADLSVAGSVTFDTSDMPNINNRKYLAAYIYVTTDEVVSSGTTVTFKRVMLEKGDTRHNYIPYTEILPTDATKGAYNYTDLNRVERAVAEISDILGSGLITKTDWDMWDIPTASDMERYLNNVVILRQQVADDISVPELPMSMNNLTYTDANNIELVLDAVYEQLTS